MTVQIVGGAIEFRLGEFVLRAAMILSRVTPPAEISTTTTRPSGK